MHGFRFASLAESWFTGLRPANSLSLLCRSGLNFQDLMVRVGAIDSPPKTPVILGFECAGEVEAVAEGVDNLKVQYSTVQ